MPYRSRPLLALLFLACLPVFAEPEARVVVDRQYFYTLMKALDSAKKSVDVLQFSFAIADDDGNLMLKSEPYQVANKLLALKRVNPSMRIRVFVEGDRSTSARNKVTAEFLRQGGIDVREGSTHAKGFAIDGKILLLGSSNLTIQSLTRNNETNLILDGYPQTIRGFTSYFESLWDGAPRTAQAFPPIHPEKGVQLLTDGLYKARLIDMIYNAKKTLDFSIYYFNDADVEIALKEAHRRGVVIRGYVNQHRSFALNLVQRNRDTVARLQKSGLKDVVLDQDSFFTHSKFIIADGTKVLLGTGNWNHSDFEVHPQLHLQVEDAGLCDRLARHLSHQIAYESPRPKPERLYYRFWIGEKREELPLADFDAVIRDRFLRATVVTGAGGGLHGYIPVLPALPRNGPEVPEEIALVIYNDEQTYRAIREGIVGSVYGPLHFDYFDRRSQSSVPLPFTGTAHVGASYDLSEPGVDWQTGHTVFAMSRAAGAGNPSADLQEYFEALQKARHELGLSGYVVHAGDKFLIEYFHFSRPFRPGESAVFNSRFRKLLPSYHHPFHLEAANRTGYDRSLLTRPTGQSHASLSGAPGAGVETLHFDPTLDTADRILTSEVSFSWSQQQRDTFATQIKEAFVKGKPVPFQPKERCAPKLVQP